MDKELKKLITETVQGFFRDAPEKLVERGIHEIYYDICPHCKVKIQEKHDYTEDGGITWRHQECKGLIARPSTPLEEISDWLRPGVEEARKQRNSAREAMELPPSGEEKYNKQEPGGEFGTSNSATIGNV